MKIIKLKKILMSLVFLFLFSSCDDFGKKKPVTSGTAQAYTNVFSKQCSGGKVDINIETVSETQTGAGVSVNVDDLKPGNKVQISGAINTHLCGVSGSISFSCDGVVNIDTNRAFTCRSGTIGSGVAINSSSISSSPPAPAFGVPTHSGFYTMNGGEVYIYQNGTKVSTKIIVSKAPYLQGCPISFICE